MSEIQAFEKRGPVEQELRQAIASTEDIIAEARAGRMYILVDHEDRENEGDLVIPAQFADAAAINFMATHGRGLICLPMTSERIDHLGLPMMAVNNSSRHETAFTVSIEAREGVSTGISAADRALTVSVAINDQTTTADIATPGHVFPLRAQKWRRPCAGRPYRGGGGYLAAGGAASGRGDLRDYERRWHYGAPA